MAIIKDMFQTIFQDVIIFFELKISANSNLSTNCFNSQNYDYQFRKINLKDNLIRLTLQISSSSIPSNLSLTFSPAIAASTSFSFQKIAPTIKD